MTNATPIWLLDVDGVLNALPWRDGGTAELAWHDYAECGATPYETGDQEFLITYSPTLMARIRELHESGAVEVRWLTTWGRGANLTLNKKLGLPEFAVAGEPEYVSGYAGAPSHRWWKFDDARRVHAAEPERPVIWTDDDLRHVPDAFKWALDKGWLAISTDNACGITPADLARIETFVAECAAAVAS